MIFNESYYQVASFLPKEGAYGTFLHGKVVDMLYFPIIQTTWPSWVPFWGGQDFQFFRPVFNIADSSISVGVLALIFFQKQFIKREHTEDTETAEETISAEGNEETIS